MLLDKSIGPLPQNFNNEHHQLLKLDITTWTKLKNLTNSEINYMVQTGKSSTTNLKRLRGIAELISEMEIKFEEAALLLHSGLATVDALAAASPQEIVQKTGRLDRKLNVGRPPLLDLAKANSLIESAQAKQLYKINNKVTS